MEKAHDEHPANQICHNLANAPECLMGGVSARNRLPAYSPQAV
jgi:hypothetical protein